MANFRSGNGDVPLGEHDLYLDVSVGHLKIRDGDGESVIPYARHDDIVNYAIPHSGIGVNGIGGRVYSGRGASLNNSITDYPRDILRGFQYQAGTNDYAVRRSYASFYGNGTGAVINTRYKRSGAASYKTAGFLGRYVNKQSGGGSFWFAFSLYMPTSGVPTIERFSVFGPIVPTGFNVQISENASGETLIAFRGLSSDSFAMYDIDVIVGGDYSTPGFLASDPVITTYDTGLSWVTYSPTGLENEGSLFSTRIVAGSRTNAPSYALHVTGAQASTTASTFTVVSDERTKTLHQVSDEAILYLNSVIDHAFFEYNGKFGSVAGVHGFSVGSAQAVLAAFNQAILLFLNDAAVLTEMRDVIVQVRDVLVDNRNNEVWYYPDFEQPERLENESDLAFDERVGMLLDGYWVARSADELHCVLVPVYTLNTDGIMFIQNRTTQILNRRALSSYVRTPGYAFATLDQIRNVIGVGRWLDIVTGINAISDTVVRGQFTTGLQALALAGGLSLQSEMVSQFLSGLVGLGLLTQLEYDGIYEITSH